jgi:23S rRNA maturation-related 3'-5' exoribonuclease YhaM
MNDRQVRIVSDGTALGTKVYDATGHEIKGCITKIVWAINGDRRVGRARITFDLVEIDLIGERRE